MECNNDQKLVLRALRHLLTGQDLENTDILQDIDAKLEGEAQNEAETKLAAEQRRQVEQVTIPRVLLVKVIKEFERLSPTSTICVALRTELYR